MTLFWNRIFTDIIKDLEMRWSGLSKWSLNSITKQSLIRDNREYIGPEEKADEYKGK